MKLCEEPRWDSTQKNRCKHIGFDICVLLNKAVSENAEGWRMCHSKCPKPFWIDKEHVNA